MTLMDFNDRRPGRGGPLDTTTLVKGDRVRVNVGHEGEWVGNDHRGYSTPPQYEGTVHNVTKTQFSMNPDRSRTTVRDSDGNLTNYDHPVVGRIAYKHAGPKAPASVTRLP